MKISEILNEKIDNGPGKIKNVPKLNYDSRRSSAVSALSKSEQKRISQELAAAKEKQREMAKATKLAMKAAEKEARMNTYDERRKAAARAAEKELSVIADKIFAVVGDTWPDGDPIDHLGPWMKKRFGESVAVMDYLDKAIRKWDKTYNGYYDYLAKTWHDFTMDQRYDEFMQNFEGGDFKAAAKVWHDSESTKVAAELKKENPWR